MRVIHKRIACVCGAAIAGSTSIKYQLEEFFEREGIDDVEIICCRFRELEEAIRLGIRSKPQGHHMDAQHSSDSLRGMNEIGG